MTWLSDEEMARMLQKQVCGCTYVYICHEPHMSRTPHVTNSTYVHGGILKRRNGSYVAKTGVCVSFSLSPPHSHALFLSLSLFLAFPLSLSLAPSLPPSLSPSFFLPLALSLSPSLSLSLSFISSFPLCLSFSFKRIPATFSDYFYT